MKKTLIKFSVIMLIAFALTSCYPGGAEYTSDTDIVVTDYNPDYNFNSIQTYFLSDSIQHITEEGENIDYSKDAFIISELERNFENLGWERLAPTDSLNPGPEPDVTVVVTLAKVTTFNIYSYPWYPYWGWGWYWKSTKESTYWGYPGYGWYYPYSPTYITSYTTGTIAWNLFDPDLVDDAQERINVGWIGVANGVVGSSTSTTKDRITRAIDQAFRQSPYLSE